MSDKSQIRLNEIDLIPVLQQKEDITDEQAKSFIDAYFTTIADELRREDVVSIYKFGTFKKYINTRGFGGENIPVDEKQYSISFTPTPSVADTVNKIYSHLKAEEIIEPEPVAEETTPIDVPTDAPISTPAIVEEEKFVEENISEEVAAEKEIIPFDEFDQDEKIEIVLEKEEPEPAEEKEPSPQPVYTPPMHIVEKKEILRIVHVPEASRPAPAVQPAPPQEQLLRIVVSDDGVRLPKSSLATSSINDGRKVREQVIERQVIKQQVIERQVLRENIIHNGDEDSMFDSTRHVTDIGEESENDKSISLWWFFAGIAVICAVILTVILIYVVMDNRRSKSYEMTQTVTRDEVMLADVRLLRSVEPNTYAGIAFAEYGDERLWPYIYSANRLRYKDPDYKIRQSQLVLPSVPDRKLDATAIEQSAIDAYRMYRADYESRLHTERGKQIRLRAVRTLIDTEQILQGFISRYELSFAADDVALARKFLAQQ